MSEKHEWNFEDVKYVADCLGWEISQNRKGYKVKNLLDTYSFSTLDDIVRFLNIERYLYH